MSRSATPKKQPSARDKPPNNRPSLRPRMLRILIATDHPTASRDIATQLRRLEFDVQICIFDGEKLTELPPNPPDAILCHLKDYIQYAPELAQILRAKFSPRHMPIIGALQRPNEAACQHFDSTLFAPMHAAQVANRVNAMIRLGAMDGEIQRRIKTLQEDFQQDIELSSLTPTRRFRVLFIGKAAPAFMVVVNSLLGRDVDVVAAFTSFSAFDYLHGDPFDAVVMNALEQSEPALTISESMRRNAKLYHVPTLFLVNPKTFRDSEAAYMRGARDIIDAESDLDEISGRILELANYHRVHEQMKTDMMRPISGAALDTDSAVFSRAFLEAHLPRMIDDARINNAPLSLIAFQVRPSDGSSKMRPSFDPEFLSPAYDQCGSLIMGLVRMQDVVTRYDSQTYIIAFYDTDKAQARVIADRIDELVDCAGFQSGQGNAEPLILEAKLRVSTLDAKDTAEDLIESVVKQLA